MKLRSLALGGVAGVLSLGLIGVGAHATFTTSATAHQTVSAGTLGLKLYSPTATAGNTTSTLTLAAISHVGSSFFFSSTMKLTNSGSNTIKNLTLTSFASSTNTVATKVQVCIYNTVSHNTLFEGDADDVTVTKMNVTMAPGHSFYTVVQLFAGAQTTACGHITATSLPSGALGQSATFTFHVVGTG